MVDPIQVQGLAELRADLARLDAKMPRELNKIGKDAAEIVAVEGRWRVPVRTGRLRSVIKAGAQAKSAYVRAQLVYAPVIHFGWRGHNIAPNPFLYDALDAKRDEVVGKYQDGIDRLVESTVHDGVR